MLVIFWRLPQERGQPEDGQHHAKPNTDQSPCDQKVLPFDDPLPQISALQDDRFDTGKWIKLRVIKAKPSIMMHRKRLCPPTAFILI